MYLIIATFAMCSPNSFQLMIDRHARQKHVGGLVAEQSPFRRQMIAEVANYSPTPSIFVTKYVLFSEKVTKRSPNSSQFVANCSPISWRMIWGITQIWHSPNSRQPGGIPLNY